jgi:serum/glucocorticoid-regulated kinase 2
VLQIFITFKIPLPWLGLNLRPLGPVASTLTTTPLRQHYQNKNGKMQHVSSFIPTVFCFFQVGVVHRDIKPENIVIDCVGHIALADYGICEIFSPEEKVNLISTLSVNEFTYVYV